MKQSTVVEREQHSSYGIHTKAFTAHGRAPEKTLDPNLSRENGWLNTPSDWTSMNPE